jgi:chloride channel protein, CIC family
VSETVTPQPSSTDVPAAPQESILARARALWQGWIQKLFGKNEEYLFLVLAILIGVFGGLAVVCFRVAIDWVKFMLLGSSLYTSFPRVVIVPAVAGIGISALVIWVFPRSRGSGVNQTKAAVYVSNGYIPFDTVIGKFVVCALAIGSGQSLGPEDPSLQMGAGIASKIGRYLRLSQSKIRLIAPVGAAAGLAAAFNAPLASTLFVIEEVIGTWSAGVLGAIVLSAVSSAITMRYFMGAESLFRVPSVQPAHPVEFLGYAALGVAGGVVSLLFTKWIAYARPRIQALPRWVLFLLPAMAGLIVGVIGIWFPQVLGAGYSIIDQALHGEFAWKLLLVLAAMKMVATGVSFLSGTPGGMFAPTLFIGAMLGGGIGAIEHHFFPSITTSVGMFALVGMGTLFGGFLRVPITSVFMVIELSGSYTAALPVMVSSLIAYLISRHYQEVALFDMLTRQEGLILPSIEERREQEAFLVEDAMRTDGAFVVRPNEPVSNLPGKAEAPKDIPTLLRVRMGEWRLLDSEDLQRLANDGATPHTASEVKSKGPLPLLFPDESIEEAMRWLGDWPVIPVVSRADLGQLEGVLTFPDVLKAVRKAKAE